VQEQEGMADIKNWRVLAFEYMSNKYKNVIFVLLIYYLFNSMLIFSQHANMKNITAREMA